MIILEGPDGGGKTALMKRLETGLCEYGLRPGVHMGTPDRDRMWETTVERTYDAIGRDLNPMKPPLIWDRMFYSELVYAPVMGRKIAFGKHVSYVHRLIEYTQSPVIFCMPPLENVVANCEATEQHEWVTDNVQEIYARYSKLLVQFGNPNFYLWDYTIDPWPALVSALRVYINKRRNII